MEKIMFSRRHPYLFFVLVFTSVIAALIVSTSLIVSLKTGSRVQVKGEKVGVVEISGVIADAGKTLKQLKAFRQDDDIRAIVLRINSPGGGVGPSQEIYKEVLKTKKVKKVVASMGALAASGGYYAACATDGIMANPGTITGSIGVIMGYTNFQSVMEKIGLVPVVVKSGEFKDIGSPAREMTEKEHEILQDFVDTIHRQFVADVAAGRNLEFEKVAALADGRIYSGEKAETLGLVDRLGNFEDAVAWAGEMAGIEGEVSAVYPEKEKFSIVDYLDASSLEGILKNVFDAGLRAEYIVKP